MHECTHLYTHNVIYTACTPYICHTYSTYTYSTLALLRKWNLVHNTYIHSCTVHLYARILMKNIKHVYTHSHTHMYTLHVRSILNFVLCTSTCIIFHLTALCMYLISIPCPFALCVWSWFSVHRHSHRRSRRCEIKLSYWAQPLLNFFLFAMLSFVPLA